MWQIPQRSVTRMSIRQTHMRGGPSAAKEGTMLRSMQLVTTQGDHKMKTWRTVAGGREKSCVKDTSKQVMRRRSSVEGVDTQLKKDRAIDKQDLTRRRHLDRDSCIVLDEEGTLWRGRAGAVSLATLQDVYNHTFLS
ncbi:uncharacterized protein UHOD_11210 [Ustilago sp. UG-2017b]|nr:uncharacterized protein UHOD_11210 [Ustilago sp. UG-2017b]